MPHLSLSLLGPFQVMLDGQPVTGFKSNKARALLAYLAVEADRTLFLDAEEAIALADEIFGYKKTIGGVNEYVKHPWCFNQVDAYRALLLYQK